MFEGRLWGDGGRARLSLSRKGMLITALPAAFQLILLAALFMLSSFQARERASEDRKREVITSANRLLGLVIDTETAMRGYLLTDRPQFLEPYERATREIPSEMARLRALVDVARLSTPIDEVERLAKGALAFQAENRALIVSGNRARALDNVRNGMGKERTDAFRASIQKLLDGVERSALLDERRTAQARNKVHAAMAIGTIANILICIGLMVYFSRKFAQRLSAVIDNTRRIERNEPLLPPLPATDEIGNLDRRVHEMAEALKRSDDARTRAQGDLDHFFTVSLDMLCIAGFDGYFKRLNPAWQETLGYSSQELCSAPWLDFVHPDDRNGTIAQGQRLLEGWPVVRFENRYRHADGTYRWLLWNAAALPERQLIYAAATDVTGQKEFERALERRNLALQLANRDLESFSYSVSHDLRAPLRAVDGYARILEEDYGQTLGEDGRRLLAVVRGEARRMGVLIDDLLAFSRLGRQSLAPAALDLRQLCEEIMREVAASHPGRRIEFGVNGAPLAVADRATLRQALLNLLSNAVKYSKPKGVIHVDFGGRGGADENTYWIRDNGIGFDMRYAEKIFGVFQRLHGSEEYEGTGVGLAIVERVIARNGGRVWAEAQPGEGATFYFTLPTVEGGDVSNE